LVLLWCFTAAYGRGEPGRAIDSDGDSIDKQDLVAASRMTESEFDQLIDILLEMKSIDADAWSRGELYFTGMRSRSDGWTQRLGIRDPSPPPKPPQQAHKKTPKETPKKAKTPVAPPARVTELKDLWNSTVTQPLPQVQRLSPQRIRKAQIAVKEYGYELLVQAISATETSPFCRGGGGRGWVATFDFLISGDHAVKVLEGAYDAQPEDAPSTRSARNRRALSEFAGSDSTSLPKLVAGSPDDA
jgi:hypothetical protein|tara:strand:+ start:3413 stop:4144 length:732 start_codon:yes stop_codon:yes gene_type:complete